MFGDLEKLVWRKPLEIWKRKFGGSEKTCGVIRWRFGGNVFGDLEKTYSAMFGENVSAIWRNRSAILYWSSLWSIVMLGDRMWRLSSNGEKMETIYGDQIFIYHKVESTYQERFKDRNV